MRSQIHPQQFTNNLNNTTIISSILIMLCVGFNACASEPFEYWRNTFELTLDNAFHFKYNLRIYRVTNDSRIVSMFYDLVKKARFAVSLNSNSQFSSRGYLIVTDSFESIRKFVLSQSFIVQRTIYICYFLNNADEIPPESVDDLFRVNEPFKTMLAVGGLDIVINKIYTNFESKWKRTSIAKMEITSLRNGTSVFEELDQWEPDFQSVQKVFKIIVFDCRPHIYYDKELGVYGGWEKDMIDLLMERTKWPYEYVVKPRDYYQKAYSELENKTADATVCAHMLGPITSLNIDRTNGHMQACLTFLVPKPERLPLSTFVFQPFNLRVWMCVTWGLLVLGVLYNLKNRDFAQSVLKILQLLVGGSVPMFPKSIYLRTVVTTTTFVGILLCTMFMASYARIFQYPRFSKPIRTLSDMMERNLEWGEQGVATLDLYNSIRSEYFQPLLNRFVLYSSAEERDAQLLKKPMAMSTHVFVGGLIAKLDTLNITHLKRMMLLNECYGDMYVTIPLVRNSPFARVINEMIYHLREHGFIRFFLSKVQSINFDLTLNKHWLKTPHTEDYKYADFNLEEVSGAFYLLLAGLTLSFVTFLCEICVDRIERQNTFYKYEN